MNECHFLGNLTRDPELTNLKNDKRVVKFGIAINRKFKRGAETVSEPAFLDCEAWDSGADLIAKFFKKGDPIIVHCSVRQETWDDKNGGGKRSKLVHRVNKFDFVPGAKKNRDEDGEQAQRTRPAEPAAEDDDASIPF